MANLRAVMRVLVSTLLFAVLWSFPLGAATTTIHLYPNRPHPGDVAAVGVRGVDSGVPLKLVVLFLGSRVTKRTSLLPGDGNKILLIAIPLDAKGFLLRVKRMDGVQLAGVRVLLSRREAPLSRLRLDKRYLTPPKNLRKRIEAQRRRLRAILSHRSAFWYPSGAPMMPLARYRKTTPFGARRVINGVAVSPHSGVDLAAPAGTPVRAVFGGRVVLAERLYYTGNTVVLDHGRGFFTLYAHLSSFKVKMGELVNKGGVIGKVGSTGRATGPHLHWGAYLNGAKVDPLSLFSLPPYIWSLAGR